MMPYIEEEDGTPIEGMLGREIWNLARAIGRWRRNFVSSATAITTGRQMPSPVRSIRSGIKKHPHPKEEGEYCEEPARKKARVTIKNIDKLRNALHVVQGDGTDVSTTKTVIEDIKDVQSHTPAPSRPEAMITLKILLYSLCFYIFY
jgi:hypothetical protein